MKAFVIIIIVLFSLNVSGQVDTIPHPFGFSRQQLRLKNLLRISPDDHIWIGFQRIGAGEYDGSTWKMLNDTNGLPSKNVTAFAFEGSIKWIGTDSGLVKKDGGNFTLFDSTNSPLPSNKVNYLFKTDSTLWIATNNGIVTYDGTIWNIYNTSNSLLTSDSILCFNKNNFGLYASTKNGIFLLSNNIWNYIGRESSPVIRITSDKFGHLFTSLNQIKDTALIPIKLLADPCFFQDNLFSTPSYIFGGPNNNKTYLIIQSRNYDTYLINIDSTLNIDNVYIDEDFDFDEPFIFGDYSCQLYDINSDGELISTRAFNVFPYSKISRSNFSGITQLQQSDSCYYLDINQVRARIWNNGSMFWDLRGSGLYEVPKGSGTISIFAEGLWLGGKDDQDKLHIAAQTYRQSGGDFWPGPLDTTNATIDSSTQKQYDKLWKIDRYTINDFILNFQNGSVSNGTYPIPEIILNWPAHGSGNISRSLAPFVDNNLDGFYNPMDGDYPKIKGDQMFWWVFNDNFSPHEETNSFYNLGVEIHGSAYAYTCPSLITDDSVINYTTFYHYDFINRSDTSYHDVYTGIFTDTDMGNYLDDFVGCDTINDIAFSYNGDDDDDGWLGYGLHPPMINLALLNGPEAAPNDAMDNNHNGIIDEPGENCMMNYFIYWNGDATSIGNPNTAIQYYYRIQGRWKDGSHIVYGATGFDPSSTNYTNYMFSGIPYDTTNGWSESHPCDGCTPNTPSDRRIFVSSGPFDLPAHQQRSLDYAYVYTREPRFPNGPNTSLVVNHDQVMRIKNFFETDSFPCAHLIGINEIKKEELSVNLFPNPAHSEIFVSIHNEKPGLKSFYITDLPGREISTPIKISSSQFRIDLSMFKPGIYFLHLQTNFKSCVRKFVVE